MLENVITKANSENIRNWLTISVRSKKKINCIKRDIIFSFQTKSYKRKHQFIFKVLKDHSMLRETSLNTGWKTILIYVKFQETKCWRKKLLILKFRLFPSSPVIIRISKLQCIFVNKQLCINLTNLEYPTVSNGWGIQFESASILQILTIKIFH